MDLGRMALLCLAGVGAGFVNVNAGGGSFLTIPLLMVLGGMTAVEANGTNRIAVLVLNLMAIWRFRRKGFRDLRQGMGLALSAIAGSILGSHLAQDIGEPTFRVVFAILMLLGLVVVLRKPPASDACSEHLRHPVLQVPLFFLVGLYGGFVQAGTGFLIIFALSMVGGLSLVRTNSLKVVIIAAYLVPSLAVFLLNGNVRWGPGVALTAGSALGGWLGAGFAVKRGDRWIRLVLLVAMLALAGKMAGLY